MQNNAIKAAEEIDSFVFIYRQGVSGKDDIAAIIEKYAAGEWVSVESGKFPETGDAVRFVRESGQVTFGWYSATLTEFYDAIVGIWVDARKVTHWQFDIPPAPPASQATGAKASETPSTSPSPNK